MAALVSACDAFDYFDRLPDVPEALSFSGNITGTLDNGVSVLSHTTDPIELGHHTRCSDYVGQDQSTGARRPVFMATITGTVGQVRLTLGILVRGDSTAYLQPGTPDKVDAIEWGNDLLLPGDRQDWPRFGGDGGIVTMDADHKGGTITESYALTDGSAANAYPGVTKVTGHWRCG
ncbi:hypothetical protein ACFXHA_22825 [Nocardia sp. NPDC059240]|uniref:hypothetical protein n=1 Tax=Nocardia sp. NPDC059240 TaxID=3346786 RepID=UPI0036920949